MRRITVIERVTLDGVMQAPGSKDEDTRDGFELGGWGLPYNDDVISAQMGKGMGGADLLFGRRTYQILHEAWAKRTDPNPFTKILNDTPKYVVSRSLRGPLPWVNSTLLGGTDRVAQLRADAGPDLAVMGSGELVRSLLAAGLVDELTLLIHPLVLGSGHRLFDGADPSATLELAESVTSPTGVVIASYRPVAA